MKFPSMRLTFWRSLLFWGAGLSSVVVISEVFLFQLSDITSRTTISWIMGLGQLVFCLAFWTALRQLGRQPASKIKNIRQQLIKSKDHSTDISKIANKISVATLTQVSAIQETTATLEQMRSTGQRNLSHSMNSYDRAADSYEMTVAARKKMLDMRGYIEKMGQSSRETQDQMFRTNDNMADIVKTIGEIKAKTNIINDIVFQTKMLSFNASVEAARAGEHGKGFAVVAEEVGQLASMSGNASKEIASLLDASIGKVTEIATETKSRAESISEQNKLQTKLTEQTAGELNLVFDQIVSNNEQVKTMMSEVSRSIEQYANGVKNIADAMRSLDQSITDNTELAQSVTKSSRGVVQTSSGLVESLTQLEGDFVAQGRRDLLSPEKSKLSLERDGDVVPLRSDQRFNS